MINGIYKLTNFPDLSKDLSLDFTFTPFVISMGSSDNSETYTKLIVISNEEKILFDDTVAFEEGAWVDYKLRNIFVMEQEFEGEEWIINNQKRTAP
jgi:hypothetical protein